MRARPSSQRSARCSRRPCRARWPWPTRRRSATRSSPGCLLTIEELEGKFGQIDEFLARARTAAPGSVRRVRRSPSVACKTIARSAPPPSRKPPTACSAGIDKRARSLQDRRRALRVLRRRRHGRERWAALAAQLADLGDSAYAADEVRTKLTASVRQDALRSLRDKERSVGRRPRHRQARLRLRSACKSSRSSSCS